MFHEKSVETFLQSDSYVKCYFLFNGFRVSSFSLNHTFLSSDIVSKGRKPRIVWFRKRKAFLFQEAWSFPLLHSHIQSSPVSDDLRSPQILEQNKEKRKLAITNIYFLSLKKKKFELLFENVE